MKKTVRTIDPAAFKGIADTGSYAGSVILDILTTGRFWRNSRITDLRLIAPDPDRKAWIEVHFSAANEPEEFEILSALPEELKPFEPSILMTFNGHTFDLPYLKRKFMAYGLMDPFAPLDKRDLMADYRGLTTLLALPSYRLNDFIGFFPACGRAIDRGVISEDDEALPLLYLLNLDNYLALYRGEWTFKSAYEEAGFLFYEIELPHEVPRTASYRDGSLHVRFEGKTARIASPITSGQVRLYFKDFSEYDYLPGEGQAVHKSLSRFVDSSRREPAQRETAFSLIPYEKSLVEDERRRMSYLKALVGYLAYPFNK